MEKINRGDAIKSGRKQPVRRRIKPVQLLQVQLYGHHRTDAGQRQTSPVSEALARIPAQFESNPYRAGTLPPRTSRLPSKPYDYPAKHGALITGKNRGTPVTNRDNRATIPAAEPRFSPLARASACFWTLVRRAFRPTRKLSSEPAPIGGTRPPHRTIRLRARSE